MTDPIEKLVIDVMKLSVNLKSVRNHRHGSPQGKQLLRLAEGMDVPNRAIERVKPVLAY